MGKAMRVLLGLLLAAPLIELWLIIRVGSHLGALTTIALLIGAGLLGMNLLRQQSLSTLMRVDQRLQGGELPAGEILEGFALTLAAALLLIPGFITDVLALPLLIPPLRRGLVRHYLGSAHFSAHYRSGYRQTQTGAQGDIIDGEWRREDGPRLR